MPSLLFVCVHNACRSQISEAIAKSLAPKAWIIASAGSRASQEVDPKAVKILEQNNLKMGSLKPKGFADLPKQEWDFVVGMGCGDVCPYVPAKKFIEWDVADPCDGPMSVYEALFENLNRHVRQLVDEVKNVDEDFSDEGYKKVVKLCREKGRKKFKNIKALLRELKS